MKTLSKFLSEARRPPKPKYDTKNPFHARMKKEFWKSRQMDLESVDGNTLTYSVMSGSTPADRYTQSIFDDLGGGNPSTSKLDGLKMKIEADAINSSTNSMVAKKMPVDFDIEISSKKETNSIWEVVIKKL